MFDIYKERKLSAINQVKVYFIVDSRCVCERERECVCVCVCVCVCARVYIAKCVHMCAVMCV